MELRCLWSMLVFSTVFVSVFQTSTTELTAQRKRSESGQRTGRKPPRPRISSLEEFRERQERFLSAFNLLTSAPQSCRYDDQRNGTCMQGSECRASGGKYHPLSSCGGQGSRLGVCCLLELSCGGTVSERNNTYFANPSFPENVRAPQTCELKVPAEDSCFIRLDFLNFVTHPPVNGSCVVDQFFVPELMNSVPMICGYNNNSHMYISLLETSQIRLRFNLGEWTGERQWLIKVARISCDSPWRPPGHSCLQYFMDKAATVKSFNFNERASEESRMIAGQDYTVCVRQLKLQCYNKWSSNSFWLSPSNGTSVVGDGCTDNFVTISRAHDITQTMRTYDRFCGDVFSALRNSTKPADVYSDIYPFHMKVHTSKNYTSLQRGFRLRYRQLQCLQPPVGMYKK